mmetsp:Transcript_23759/g.82618  ORF Transcript_23759/g.82618 Transcript_23759/m.82618 type:complete len:277 (+) Transcript_23759:900-1730(+)
MPPRAERHELGLFCVVRELLEQPLRRRQHGAAIVGAVVNVVDDVGCRRHPAVEGGRRHAVRAAKPQRRRHTRSRVRGTPRAATNAASARDGRRQARARRGEVAVAVGAVVAESAPDCAAATAKRRRWAAAPATVGAACAGRPRRDDAAGAASWGRRHRRRGVGVAPAIGHRELPKQEREEDDADEVRPHVHRLVVDLEERDEAGSQGVPGAVPADDEGVVGRVAQLWVRRDLLERRGPRGHVLWKRLRNMGRVDLRCCRLRLRRRRRLADLSRNPR